MACHNDGEFGSVFGMEKSVKLFVFKRLPNRVQEYSARIIMMVAAVTCLWCAQATPSRAQDASSADGYAPLVSQADLKKAQARQHSKPKYRAKRRRNRYRKKKSRRYARRKLSVYSYETNLRRRGGVKRYFNLLSEET